MVVCKHPCRARGNKTSARIAFVLARALLILLACALVLPSISHAQDDAPSAYKKLVAEALTEFDAQNYLESRALFLRAHKLQPNARTLRGLGAVAFELRRYAESVFYLDAALVAPEKPLTGPLRSESERLRARARGFVAELHFSLTPPSTSVILDGEPFVTTGAPAWLDIGKHTVAFEADGYVSEQRSYSAEGGESDTWTITLQPLSKTSAPRLASAALPAGAAGPSAPSTLSDSASEPEAQPSALRAKRLVLASSLLAGAGAISLGLGAWRFHEHLLDGRQVRSHGPEAIGVQKQWQSSRPLPLALSGVGVGLLAVSSALVAGLVPVRTRRWLSPVLLAVGAGTLATGFTLASRGARCEPHSGEQLRECALAGERRDRGLIVSMVSIPFLTIPVLHTIAWLR